MTGNITGASGSGALRLRRLQVLFERVAAAHGLQVHVMKTHGSEPVGRGIGPALEARDVLSVLCGAARNGDAQSVGFVTAGTPTTNIYANTVFVLNLAGRQVVAAVRVGKEPKGISVTP